MKYTNEYPTVPGWYWARNLAVYLEGTVGVVEVFKDLTMNIPGWGEDDKEYIMSINPDAEFAGPIPEPQDLPQGIRCWKQGIPIETVMQGDRCFQCGITITSPSWNTYHFDPRHQP